MRPVLALVLAACLASPVAGCAGPSPSPIRPSGTSTGAASSPPASVRTVAPTTATASLRPSRVPPSALPSGPPVDLADLTGTIAFSHDDGIWIADADGGNRRQVTRDGGFDPTLSPDGRRIVYRLLLEHDDGEIWVVDASGSNARNLVNDPEFSDWGPAFSPDGTRIAFDSNRRVGLALWLMDADGTDQKILTTGHGEYPTWSPDGTQLAYAGGAYYDIWIVAADGSSDRPLTSTAAYDMGPAWSPDGAWIAYHTQVDAWPDVGEAGMGDEMEIHLVRPDGSDDHRITADQVEDGFPTWSPDGRHLMWSRHGELVVARPDGSGRVGIGPGNFPTWVP